MIYFYIRISNATVMYFEPRNDIFQRSFIGISQRKDGIKL